MGFHHKPKNITLKFEDDHEYAGFECVFRGMRLGEYMELVGLSEVTTNEVGSMVAKFAASLLSWNLEDEDGNSIPPTKDAVYELDRDFVLSIYGAWMEAVSEVSAPLEKSSPSGELSQVESIPMEALSPSLAS